MKSPATEAVESLPRRSMRPGQATGARDTPPAAKARPIIQSVDRAFDVLEALARSAGKLSLAELSLRAGLNVSTCHHLVATMLGRGYIIQDRETRRYSLSSKVFEFSEARTRQIDLVALAMPSLQRLNRATGEAVHLAVIEGTDLITVAKLSALHAVRVDHAMSQSNAAHATAAGKAILAWLPESEIDGILAAKGLERFTADTIAGRDALVEALRLVRRHGYSLDREEFRPGVYGLGAAIRSHKGTVVGSVALSLPMMRATDEIIPTARRAVIGAALQISKELGSGGALAEGARRDEAASGGLPSR